MSGGLSTEAVAPSGESGEGWPLFEVFVRPRRGLSHIHVGSLHAPDASLALHNARDLFTRRQEGVSIWVVRASSIAASPPEKSALFFSAAEDKPYRYPAYYEVPSGAQL
jgi:ring-1,2-phenylacetyl-CoA epoxidase subunit PaaB